MMNIGAGKFAMRNRLMHQAAMYSHPVQPVDYLLYLFIGEFAIFRVLTHLVPYLKIQRILVN